MKNTCIKTFLVIYTATFYALSVPIIEKETDSTKDMEHEIVRSSPKRISIKRLNPKLPNIADMHKYTIQDKLRKIMKNLRQIRMKLNVINKKIDRKNEDEKIPGK